MNNDQFAGGFDIYAGMHAIKNVYVRVGVPIFIVVCIRMDVQLSGLSKM